MKFKHYAKHLAIGIGALLWLTSCGSDKYYTPAQVNDLRAPAYPLITIDPYTSAWSMADNLYDLPVKHWTGHDFPMLGIIKVDGECYRFMGNEKAVMKQVVNTADKAPWKGNYTFEKPASEWMNPDFNDSAWKKGTGAFGTPAKTVKTDWPGTDIWVRRTIEIEPELLTKDLILEYSHDDNLELYINGKEVVNTGNACAMKQMKPLTGELKALLKPGKNIIAAHCKNPVGGAYLDFGIWEKPEFTPVFPMAAKQVSANVMPTQTYYAFECGGVLLDVIFTSPLLMDDLDLLSRPVNYITYQVKSVDGKSHDVAVYFDATPQWAQDRIYQPVTSSMEPDEKLFVLKTGTKEQDVLGQKGDDVRIDWGYFYLSGEKKQNRTAQIGRAAVVQEAFVKNSALDNSADETLTGDISEEMEVLAISDNLQKVGEKPVCGYIMVGYDDRYSIQYFGENLLPYWNRKGDKTIMGELSSAAQDYTPVMDKCAAFDKDLMKRASEVGGEKYADLCALVYRQAISAHKLVEDKKGELLFLSKENFSNGSIGTVDISYPSIPLFLVYNTDLAKGLMNHIFYYSESGKWNKPFAAHDVGTYPMANGQTYGGDMPVEESGNMLIMTTAVTLIDGNTDYAEKHWDVLTTWANYLLENGLDPENQLCTDDFAGHFAHNVNLSVKAIVGISGYAKMADLMGKKEISEKYMTAAKEMARKWEEMANDGDHYRLTFDKPNTWSQKYNMVWDKLFETGLFPEYIYKKELAYYLSKQNKYGLPLDNRRDYTKSDWILWTATMAEEADTFNALVDPVWLYANETTSRVPISDWHETILGTQHGFQARSVVGGYYMPILKEKMLKK
ncbi:glutaminase family protein [Coprobacter tertius]|uniref:DUF4965 domain-containing protein n=1 Tax=Coprobacter tertius TaxID=2944915 RepID=A0ABT1MLE7_9BACT|nr:glutaminase family protein [Coprobacter tertius]MCP9612533.1 DUF4965 domain-containing protein [Coprobacter tertius]